VVVALKTKAVSLETRRLLQLTIKKSFDLKALCYAGNIGTSERLSRPKSSFKKLTFNTGKDTIKKGNGCGVRAHKFSTGGCFFHSARGR